MSDSVLSAIQTQLVADIETTSIAKCNIGVSMNQTRFPRAELFVGGGMINTNITQVFDRNVSVVVRVYGQSLEQVEYALQELLKLWYNASRRAALGALGVINIMPASVYPPIVFSPQSSTGSTTQTPIIGDVEFRMTVRYTT